MDCIQKYVIMVHINETMELKGASNMGLYMNTQGFSHFMGCDVFLL